MGLPAPVPAPTAWWECQACTLRREVPCAHVGAGTPACPTCKGPMVLVVYSTLAAPALTVPEPKAALSLAQRDPDTVMEVDDETPNSP